MKHITIRISILVFSVFCFHNFSFTQTTFGDQTIIFESSAKWPQSVYSADLDGDGDMDVLSASRGDNKIAWYENIDGLGTFGDEKVITTLAWEARSVYATDLDDDGDMDVLSASYKDDKIAWYENADGNGTFGAQHVITTLADGAICVYSCDLDGDGDMDVLSASVEDDKIAWYNNMDGQGTFSLQNVISDSADGTYCVYAADLDNDGDMDVLSALVVDDEIVWYENTDGLGTFGVEQVITNAVNGPGWVSASDLDGDGDIDVLSASGWDSKIAWYENTDGQGTFGVQLIITDLATFARSVSASDLDGDGDIDVLSASNWDDKIAWYENTDGIGTFGAQRVITNTAEGAECVYASDLDGDGDMDVLFAAGGEGDVLWGTGHFFDKIAWYENTDGYGTFVEKPVTKSADGASSVYASDLDGDGDLDVLAASRWDNKITFYENIDGNGVFGSQQVITDSAREASSVTASDLDGDGDMDVLSASFFDDKIAWYENIDNNLTFGEQQIITTSARGATSVHTSDLDGDGDMDVLSASWQDWKIAWYENIDGLGTFGDQKVITSTANGAQCVYTSDLDNDGDMDVLLASYTDDKIAWHENYDGLGTFGAQQVISTSVDGAWSVFTSDLDGDGDMDVLSASKLDHKIAWYENTDGQGTFGNQKVITSYATGALCVYAVDLDNDGDMDVLSALYFIDRICWYENTDGQGTFGDMQFIGGVAGGASSVYASDMDRDGDMDVLYTCMKDDKIAWNRNLFIETGVNEEEPVIPNDFKLSQNYPNPFNNETVISFDVKEKGNVNLTIYNMLGKPVVTIAEGYYQPGSYQVRFDGEGLPSGIYFYRLQAEGYTEVRKMVLME